MLRSSIPLACVVLSAVCADAGHQAAAQDIHGDPLPPGAVARLGTVRFRHESSVVFAGFLPGGKAVLSVSDDGVICAWRFPDGKQLRRIETQPVIDRPVRAGGPVTGATLSPDGKYLTLFGNDGFMRIWEWGAAKETGKVAVVRGAATSAQSIYDLDYYGTSVPSTIAPVYSPDGKTLLLTSRVLQFIDLPSGKEMGPAQGHTDSLISISFTPDGKHIVTKDQKTTRTWNAATGKEAGSLALKLPAAPGSPTIISPDGRVGVSVARFTSAAVAREAKAREAILFDTATGDKLGKIDLEVQTTPIHRRPLVFAPDSKVLAVNAGDAEQKIELYDVPSGKLLRTLNAGAAAPPPKALGRFGPGVGGFAPAGFAALAAGQRMLFSPDGRTLAFQAGPAAGILVLDTATGKQLSALPADEGNLLLQGAFAPDGRCLALENRDGSVTLYELATGRPRRIFDTKLPPRATTTKSDTLAEILGVGFPGGGGPAFLYTDKTRGSVAISPDGKTLALSGPGGTVHLWDVLSGKESTLLKGHSGIVNALAFAPNGKTLASASHDTTALVWDMTKISRVAPAVKAVQPKDLEAWWQALGDSDAGKGIAAIAALTAAPKDAVAMLKDRVKPATPLDMTRAAELMTQLDADQFKTRENATRELLRLGDLTLPLIEKAMAAPSSAETRRRLEELRTKLTTTALQGERLRVYRGVEVLELIGTPEARSVLQTLAGGAPGALVTTSAQAAPNR
jgi:WD40 repeat protein